MNLEDEDLEVEEEFDESDSLDDCRRCGRPLEDRIFKIRVESEPAVSDPVEMRICEPCMESLARWTNRDSNDRGRRTTSRSRRTVYTEQLDRNTTLLHRQHWLILGVSCFAFALIVIFLTLTAHFGGR